MKQSPGRRPLPKQSLLWQLSLACFVLAGLTGFLYRLGLVGWLPGGLGLGNIRHAHSHLMFFGWAVPFPMYILWSQISQTAGRDFPGAKLMKNGIAGGLLFGLLAYPFFLIYGYRPVEIGSASLPLSVIFSGLVMVSWYVYIGGYLKSRVLLNGKVRPWFDGSFLLLLVCSLGAWGVAVVQAADPAARLLMKALTHFFLAAFTEGWVVLVLLGVLISRIGLTSGDWFLSANIPLALICLGAPLTFPYGISESLLTPLLLNTARLGGALAGVGLLLALLSILKTSAGRSSIWVCPLGLLAIKSVMQLVASVAPASFWLSDHGLRILYLHVLLLGAFTVAMAGWLNTASGIPKKYFSAVALSIGLTLVSLVLPTGLWPAAWSGGWIFYVLAGVALLPVLAVLVQWMKSITSQTVRMR